MNSSKRGMTLVEVMIASTILAFTLCAFLTTFVTAERAAVMADDYMEKTNEARQIMEELVACNYDNSQLNLGTHTIPEGQYIVSQNATFSDTKDIALTIYWTERGGSKTWSLSFSTSMTKGLHQ